VPTDIFQHTGLRRAYPVCQRTQPP
jgi:hypothetical protein